MSWIYVQRSGNVYWDGKKVGQGYAGNGKGKNCPEMQDVHDVGPLPCGWYTMLPPVDTETHGPYVIWLTPDAKNEMYGRSGFGIHGDSIPHPGEASKGCPVEPRWLREWQWRSSDHRLRVVSDEPSAPDLDGSISGCDG